MSPHLKPLTTASYNSHQPPTNKVKYAQQNSVLQSTTTLSTLTPHKEIYALKKLCQNAAGLFNFEITHMISDQTALHSVQLHIAISRFMLVRNFFQLVTMTVGTKP